MTRFTGKHFWFFSGEKVEKTDEADAGWARVAMGLEGERDPEGGGGKGEVACDVCVRQYYMKLW